MTDETKPQESAAMSPASAGSAVNVGQKLASRLKSFNDSLAGGERFERVTVSRCTVCNGVGYGKKMCYACGGTGAQTRRELIDPTRVTINDR
jgi:DnaJ-class molecular chaperone